MELGQFKRMAGALVVVGGLGSSGAAMATIWTCADVLANIGSLDAFSQNHWRTVEYPHCFGGGLTASTAQINATSFYQSYMISQAMRARFGRSTPGPLAANDSVSGMAAGGTPDKWNVWGSLGNTQSSVSNNTGGRTDSDIRNTVMGGDYALSPVMNAGVSLALDRGGISTLGTTGADTSTGYTLAPYLGYQLNKEWVADLTLGYGNGKYSTGTTRADTNRLFYSANLSYETWADKLQLTGRVTYMHGEEKRKDSVNVAGGTNAGTGFKNKIDQVRVGGQAGYWMNGVMPYIGLSYASDVRRTAPAAGAVDPLGRNAFVLTVGANFFSLSSKVTGGIAYESEQGRTNSKNNTLLANINFRF
jgi:hypothetical protein